MRCWVPSGAAGTIGAVRLGKHRCIMDRIGTSSLPEPPRQRSTNSRLPNAEVSL